MAAIALDEVKLSANWGATFGDYTFGTTKTDFQDLMVGIAANRATSVEGEVMPQK